MNGSAPPVLANGAAFVLGGIPTSASDRLRIRSWGTVASVALRIAGWRRLPDGLVVPFSERHVPNSDRTSATTIVPIGEGSILELSIIVESTQVTLGRVLVRADLVRGDATVPTYITTICQGIVTREQAINFPRSPLLSSGAVEPAIRSITGTDPAANTEISETVPTGAVWELLSFFASLVTDGTAANRRPFLIIDDGANIVFESPTATLQVASLTIPYTWAEGMPIGGSINSSFQVHGLVAPNRLPAGFRVRTSTISIQATDNWSAPQLLVREWMAAD